ncbi:hypothetical protein BABINDRAFT_26159, partial [Babjeviella inositovora NRRL Y-12698]
VFPALNSAQRAATTQGPRSKVILKPGHSPLDWAALKNSSANLRGIHPSAFPLRVTKEELKKHRTHEDSWTTIKGKVYNITPYLDFHPGGREELMKCAGKEGTLLFNKYHAWVNVERMLDSCMVGVYV